MIIFTLKQIFEYEERPFVREHALLMVTSWFPHDLLNYVIISMSVHDMFG